MPPLPTTFDEETLQLVASARRHENDLAEFQIPRLRSCQGPLSLQQNLAAELREDVDTFARQIEALDVLVDDQKGSKNRRELKAIVEELNENLANLRREARSALLESKRTIDSLSKSHRDELLSSNAVSEKRELNEKITDDALMAANDNVTEAMQRTMSLMQGELERSVLSAQMLADSTATLRSTSSTHDTLTNVMDTSKLLIKALEKSDWLDRIVIFAALLFFILVVLFILKQRIFDRSVRIAFWWTRFVPNFGGEKVPAAATMATSSVASAASSTTALSSVASAASVLAGSTTALSSVASAASVLASSATALSTTLFASGEASAVVSSSPTESTYTSDLPVVPELQAADSETSSIPAASVHVEL
ncbi:Sec20-domain-containing protein [Mycena metata]|uniref:Sec20-domain-containing protein n=1 Tax=Mycena metata TaxID=1033252 RepID=A0AAD7J0F9_9AGAR|nr:Sec20-domain-containing protein [Mycena metata]